MFESTAVSVRLKKSCAQFIEEFFSNKQAFMRRAIEYYCEIAMVRTQHPQGGVSLNLYNGGYGMVQYYWNYYNGRQFIVITNESGFAFQDHAIDFRTKIFEQLKITSNELVDFYIPHEQNELGQSSKDRAHRTSLTLWDFEENKAVTRQNAIPDESLVEMIGLMNYHNSNYSLNRDAFVIEKLYNANVDWEDLPSLKCKLITRNTHS